MIQWNIWYEDSSEYSGLQDNIDRRIDICGVLGTQEAEIGFSEPRSCRSAWPVQQDLNIKQNKPSPTK